MTTTLNASLPVCTVEDNKDTGSLKILSTGEKPTLPLRIHVEGEAKPRNVTYLMGSPSKGWHACTKGQGKFPLGRVTFQILPDETTSEQPATQE